MTKRYYMFIWLLCDLSWLCRLAEGEMALTGGCLTNSKPLETIASEFGSAAGYGLALLGQICRYFQLWLFLFFVFLARSNFFCDMHFQKCFRFFVSLSKFYPYFRKSEQFARAAECFKSSLKYNPFLWSSFENLCQLGMCYNYIW